MLKNPSIIEILVDVDTWIRVNMQNLEPGDIIRIWNGDKLKTDNEGNTEFMLNALPILELKGGKV